MVNGLRVNLQVQRDSTGLSFAAVPLPFQLMFLLLFGVLLVQYAAFRQELVGCSPFHMPSGDGYGERTMNAFGICRQDNDFTGCAAGTA